MARLPVPGSDQEVWGDVLNDFLLQSHSSDGTLKSNSITAAQLQNSSITPAKLSTNNSPASGQVLGFNGTDMTWSSAGPRVFVQSTDPGGAANNGDIWIDTSA